MSGLSKAGSEESKEPHSLGANVPELKVMTTRVAEAPWDQPDTAQPQSQDPIWRSHVSGRTQNPHVVTAAPKALPGKRRRGQARLGEIWGSVPDHKKVSISTKQVKCIVEVEFTAHYSLSNV